MGMYVDNVDNWGYTIIVGMYMYVDNIGNWGYRHKTGILTENS